MIKDKDPAEALAELRQELTNDIHDSRREWVDWMTGRVINSNQFTHAVTLTMRQCIRQKVEEGSGGWLPIRGGIAFERLTPDKANENFEMFIGRLNFDIYKNAWRRHQKGVWVCPVIEGGEDDGDKHYHIHAAIGFPPRGGQQLSTAEIEHKIRTNWNHTPFGKFQTEIVVAEMFDQAGWLGYMQKRIDSTGERYILGSLNLPEE